MKKPMTKEELEKLLEADTTKSEDQKNLIRMIFHNGWQPPGGVLIPTENV